MARALRLVVQWPGLPGYAAACLAALRARHGVETLVLTEQPAGEFASFDVARLSDAGPVVDVGGLSPTEVQARVAAFRPDAALVSGWTRPARLVARAARQAGASVVCGADNVEEGGGPKRLLRTAAHRLYLDRLYDRYWVPGRRSRAYLEGVGVPGERIWEGLYASPRGPLPLRDPWPRRFLFVGQFIERKGVGALLEAFSQTREAWSLTLCGEGPLAGRVADASARDGRIEARGFVQPDALPGVLAGAGALVLPSRLDHWGVALLEGAAAGLPLVATTACGAVDELVRDGVNGRLVPPDDPAALAAALDDVAARADDELRRMGEGSRELAAPFTPEAWADTLVEGLRGIAPRAGGGRP